MGKIWYAEARADGQSRATPLAAQVIPIRHYAHNSLRLLLMGDDRSARDNAADNADEDAKIDTRTKEEK